MSILSEIQRISDGVADVKQAIIDKGVNVPSNTKVDNLARYISQISTGSSGGKQVTFGTTRSSYINTTLSSVEKFVMYADNPYAGLICLVYDKFISESTVYCVYSERSRSTVNGVVNIVQSQDFSFYDGTFMWSGAELSSQTYNWFAVGS